MFVYRVHCTCDVARLIVCGGGGSRIQVCDSAFDAPPTPHQSYSDLRVAFSGSLLWARGANKATSFIFNAFRKGPLNASLALCEQRLTVYRGWPKGEF